ncbi:Ig-like domain repeat protein [Brevundimonas sp.]|uniref:Ig-like domain repeat protein n=1 Tax=Brevundimonas sp. TaxID=1871086 RepID=UPI00289CB4A8|nr:Ig-like domain repeat protein [Brevundimonas sp.]
MALNLVRGALWAAASTVCLAATPSLASGAVTVTTATADRATMGLGDTVTFTTNVTNASGTHCTGTVQLQPLPTPSTVLCGISVSGVPGSSSGSCTLSGSAIGVGTHTIGAAYGGGGTCLSSTAASNITLTVVAATAVPTVGEWTMWGLAGVLLIGGGVVASRRFRATAV